MRKHRRKPRRAAAKDQADKRLPPAPAARAARGQVDAAMRAGREAAPVLEATEVKAAAKPEAPEPPARREPTEAEG